MILEYYNVNASYMHISTIMKEQEAKQNYKITCS